MAITSTTLFTKSGSWVSTNQTLGAMSIDLANDRVWTYQNGVSLMAYSFAGAPVLESVGTWSSLTADSVTVGHLTGYAYIGDTTGTDTFRKINPLTGATVATFGYTTSTNMANTVVTATSDTVESVNLAGVPHMLAVGAFGDLMLFQVDGTNLTYLTHTNGVLVTEELRAVPISLGSSNQMRWLITGAGTGSLPTDIYLVEYSGGVLTAPVLVNITTANDNTTFGEDTDASSSAIVAFWDRINSRVILMAKSLDGLSTIMSAVTLAAPTVPVWTRKVTGSFLASSYSNGKGSQCHLDNHLAIACADGASACNLYVIRLSDGAVVDSGASTAVADFSGSTNHFIWREDLATLYVQVNGSTTHLVAFTFTATDYPVNPTYPDETDPPPGQLGASQKLIAGPVVQVVNQNTAVIQALLSELVDAASASNQNPALVLDLNGHELTNLFNSPADNAPARQV